MAFFFAVPTVWNIISTFSAVVGTVGFLQSNLPKRLKTPTDSSIRIAVGLNGKTTGLTHAAGNAPLIMAYNENEDYIGSSYKDQSFETGTIHSGGFKDLQIFQKEGPGEQATWLQIIGSPNEICIAYISQSWADGTPRGWLGDIGRASSRDWYYSNVIVGENYKPACTWLDSDHTSYITTAALQIHMNDFTNMTTDYAERDPVFYCGYPTMLFQAEPNTFKWIAGWVGGDDGNGYWERPKKPKLWGITNPSMSTTPTENNGDLGRHHRQGPRRRSRSSVQKTSLVASPDPQHRARDLCMDPSSHGPDFFSHAEGLFCDMETRNLWPACNETSQRDCYHWDTHHLVVGEDRQARNYQTFHHWE